MAKFFALSFLLQSCFVVQGQQYGNNVPAIQKQMLAAMDTCIEYMTAALICHPPKRKLEKYNHRLGSVFFDAIHHQTIGKCKNRRRRQSPTRHRRELTDFDSELDALNHVRDSVATFDQKIEDADDNNYANTYDYEYVASDETGKTEERKSKGGKILALEGKCEKQFMNTLASKQLQSCKKIKSWTKRATHLIRDIKIMRRGCHIDTY